TPVLHRLLAGAAAPRSPRFACGVGLYAASADNSQEITHFHPSKKVTGGLGAHWVQVKPRKSRSEQMLSRLPPKATTHRSVHPLCAKSRYKGHLRHFQPHLQSQPWDQSANRADKLVTSIC